MDENRFYIIKLIAKEMEWPYVLRFYGEEDWRSWCYKIALLHSYWCASYTQITCYHDLYIYVVYIHHKSYNGRAYSHLTDLISAKKSKWNLQEYAKTINGAWALSQSKFHTEVVCTRGITNWNNCGWYSPYIGIHFWDLNKIANVTLSIIIVFLMTLRPPVVSEILKKAQPAPYTAQSAPVSPIMIFYIIKLPFRKLQNTDKYMLIKEYSLLS